MKRTTVGIDLAKNVFQIHVVDEHGKTVLRKQLKRAQLVTHFSNLTPCLIGMEACGGAHHWARKLQALGHEVKLMAPQYVKPYVKTNKNDMADAEAICEAVGRPNMSFVSVKNIEQQSVLAMHRARQGFVKMRTLQSNQIRGLLSEFGLIVPKGLAHVFNRVPELIEDATNELTGGFRQVVDRLMESLKFVDKQVKEMERDIKAWHAQSEASCKIEDIPGVGPLTASAYVASVGDVKTFKNGRQVSAWVGIVPKQHSSGGKERLLGISKRGDSYLRTLLIHGARAAILANERKRGTANEDVWLSKLVARRNKNVAAVALANKNARTMWALLAHDTKYQAGYKRAPVGAAG